MLVTPSPWPLFMVSSVPSDLEPPQGTATAPCAPQPPGLTGPRRQQEDGAQHPQHALAPVLRSCPWEAGDRSGPQEGGSGCGQWGSAASGGQAAGASGDHRAWGAPLGLCHRGACASGLGSKTRVGRGNLGEEFGQRMGVGPLTCGCESRKITRDPSRTSPEAPAQADWPGGVSGLLCLDQPSGLHPDPPAQEPVGAAPERPPLLPGGVDAGARSGGQPGLPSSPLRRPTALQNPGPPSPAPLQCPFFHQMVLILQEAKQGAHLSLISEARPLMQYLFI